MGAGATTAGAGMYAVDDVKNYCKGVGLDPEKSVTLFGREGDMVHIPEDWRSVVDKSAAHQEDTLHETGELPTHTRHVMMLTCATDRRAVEPLVHTLQNQGLDVWRDVQGSESLQYDASTDVNKSMNAIDVASHVVVILSVSFLQNLAENGDCRRLLDHARYVLQAKKTPALYRLFYLSLDGTPIPEEKHVMLSYCHKCKKQLVLQVAAGLREANVDYWRDEEGSKFVPKLEAGNDDIHSTMAAAVRRSSLFVSFISPAYADSQYCMKEFDAAIRYRDNKQLEVLFVMLDENYTTTSKGEDGNLNMRDKIAFDMGRSFYSSLFTSANVAEVCEKICKFYEGRRSWFRDVSTAEGRARVHMDIALSIAGDDAGLVRPCMSIRYKAAPADSASSADDRRHAELLAQLDEAHAEIARLTEDKDKLLNKYEAQKATLVETIWQHCGSIPEMAAVLPPLDRGLPAIEGPGLPFQLGNYEVQSIINGGEFSRLLACTDDSGAHFVMKSINKSSVRTFRLLQFIANEIQMLSTMREWDCDNIAHMQEALQSTHHLYIIYAPNNTHEDLFDFLSKDNKTFTTQGNWGAKHIMRFLLEAMSFMHEKKVCHRDIRPESILIEWQGDYETGRCVDLKLSNFAHACAFQNDGLLREPKLQNLGYFAPELVSDRGEYLGDKADMWSCGCILLRLVLDGFLFYDLWETSYSHEILQDLYSPSAGVRNAAKRRFDQSVRLCLAGLQDEHLKKFSDLPFEGIIKSLLDMDPYERKTSQDLLHGGSSWFMSKDQHLPSFYERGNESPLQEIRKSRTKGNYEDDMASRGARKSMVYYKDDVTSRGARSSLVI